MAFPGIPTVANGRILIAPQANTTATRTFPSLSDLTKNAGDRLIAIVIAYQSSTTNAQFGSWGGGFTERHDSGSGTTMAIGVADKVSDGTETGTFTVTQSATITGHAVLILMSIPGAHPTTNISFGTRVSGTTGIADPGNLNHGFTGEDMLWISLAGSGETSLTGSYTGLGTAPTGFTDEVKTGMTADAIGACEGGVAFQQLNAGGLDVGQWTGTDVSNARNAALVMIVRPAPEEGEPTRVINGSTDRLDTAPGGASGFAYGTVAALVRRTAGSTGWRTILGTHTSGGTGGLQFSTNSGVLNWWNATTSVTGPTINDSDWYLVIARKATGTATPRWSVYNLATDTWTHANASGSIGNHTAPGSGGTLRVSYESVPEVWAGQIAARAIWSNEVKWSADTTGDAAIEAAGLHLGLQAWLDAAPSVLQPFNQAAVTTTVPDLTGGGATETSRTGTTVTTINFPPDFDFTISGTTHNRGPVDSAGVADTRTQVQTLDRARVDPVGATDPISRSGTAARSRVDPGGLADTPVYQKILEAVLGPDLARPLDTLARTVAYGRTRADPVGSTDTLARASASSRSRVDAAGLADVAARVSALARSRTDPSGASDVIARAHTAARSRTDSAGATDSLTYEIVGVLARNLADSVGSADAIVRLANAFRSRTDSAGSSDVIARAQTWPRGFTDSGGLADVLSRALASVRSRVDSVGADDVFGYAVISLIARSIADAARPADTLARMVAASRTRVESMGLGSILSRSSAVARSAADAAGLSDALARAATYARTRAEAVGLDDALSYVSMQLIFRSPTDSAGLRDNASRAAQWARMVSTPTGASDAVSRGVTLLRAASEDIQTTDTLGIVASYVRQAFDSAGLTDFLIITTRLPGAPNPVTADLGVIVDGVVFIGNVAGYADLVGGAGGTSTLGPGEGTSELEP